MKSVILDTNVIVSGCLSKGKPHKILQLVSNFELKIHLSDDIISEYREVCSREKFLRIASFEDTYTDLIHFLYDNGHWYDPKFRLTISSDETDNRFLELATESNADYLVTGNLRHFPKTPFNSTSIVNPADFLKETYNE